MTNRLIVEVVRVDSSLLEGIEVPNGPETFRLAAHPSSNEEIEARIELALAVREGYSVCHNNCCIRQT